MDIVEATKSYESWLRKNTPTFPADFTKKHKAMTKDVFSFLRATFYRWVVLFPQTCPELAAAPALLGVGDLHVENFGTWRDGEGRLIWGINDFDEACTLAYTSDLVRLGVSVILAIHNNGLDVDARKACADILKSYRKRLAAGHPAPFILEESNDALRDMALGIIRAPREFWTKLLKCDPARPGKAIRKLLHAHLPEGTRDAFIVRRVSGTGSLGLARYAVVGDCEGGFVAREAKARAPSALVWANGGAPAPGDFRALVANGVRAPDPMLFVGDDWVVRRLGPRCERIALTDIDDLDGVREIMRAMGAETANIHRASQDAIPAVLHDLDRRGKKWLYDAASRMADATKADWKAWKTSQA